MLRFSLQIPGSRYYAMAHNYYLPPFGPFKRFPTADGHPERLLRMDGLLCPCNHHCAFLQRWGPPGLRTLPLFAADYQYFHTCRDEASGELSLPEQMEPWGPSHVYVTMVSPSPEKGLAVFLALARRLPSVRFAAVCTQWTSAATREVLAAAAGDVTVLEANADVDVIFRQTRVLLAPSLWQECCPLIVMESVLRGIPCVSSDVFGLPEANPNARLVVRTKLCFDHARGSLHHGESNDELERRLGADPPLPSAEERELAISRALTEEVRSSGPPPPPPPSPSSSLG